MKDGHLRITNGGLMRHEQVVGIDLLRFFAACLVMAFHLGFWYLNKSGAYPLTTLHISGISQYTSAMTRYGFVGVEIFFVISGYVISYSIQGRSRTQYLRSRFLRLWPTVWVCATLCLVLAILTMQGSTSMLVYHWARSMVIFPKAPWIDGVYWTLPIEIAFYILLFFVIDHDELRGALALALGAASIGFWVCYLATHSIPQLGHVARLFDRAANDRVADIFLVHHGIYFALGIFMHSAVRKKILVPFCILAFFVAFIEISAESARLSHSIGIYISPWNAYAIWLGCMIYLALAVRYNAVLTDALGQKRVQFLRGVGLLTYPLYLVHVIVAYATAFILLRLGVPQIFAWFAGPLMAIVSAIVIAHWIEPRARRLTGSAIDFLVKRYAAPQVPILEGAGDG
jgi:peptidoglycan/LPS O-acetylase OafA/YrhL